MSAATSGADPVCRCAHAGYEGRERSLTETQPARVNPESSRPHQSPLSYDFARQTTTVAASQLEQNETAQSSSRVLPVRAPPQFSKLPAPASFHRANIVNPKLLAADHETVDCPGQSDGSFVPAWNRCQRYSNGRATQGCWESRDLTGKH